jgi:hypothetical protein
MARRKASPEDEIQAAFRVVAQATGNAAKVVSRPKETRKNPHAVALGRKGGLAAGKTRKDKIPEERRIEIAKNAAASRWGRKNQNS